MSQQAALQGLVLTMAVFEPEKHGVDVCRCIVCNVIVKSQTPTSLVSLFRTLPAAGSVEDNAAADNR